MSALATEHGAINLSQGFPGFDAPAGLIEAAARAMRVGKNQYAPMPGTLALREAIASSLHRPACPYDPQTEITITAGATQAIFTAINALIREDDEVIIFTPAYDCYAPAVELAGGSVTYIQMHAPAFRIDWEEVKKVVNRKTRMIVINTPHNPTGSCLTESDLDELEKIVIDTDIIVLSDEVYEHILFDGRTHASCASRAPLCEQSLIVGSFGKSFHLTGWKIGYIAGPEALMVEFRKVHQYNVFCVNHPLQVALAEFMSEHPEHCSQLSTFYQQKRDLFLSALEGSRFSIVPAEGSYFQLLDYSAISDEEDMAIAEKWTREIGVASIPVSAFYHNPVDVKVLRFCFAKEDATLLAAAERLKSL